MKDRAPVVGKRTRANPAASLDDLLRMVPSDAFSGAGRGKDCLPDEAMARLAEDWDSLSVMHEGRRATESPAFVAIEAHLRGCARCRASLLSAREFVLRGRNPEAVDVNISELWYSAGPPASDVPLQWAASSARGRKSWVLDDSSPFRVLATVDGRGRLLACVESGGRPVVGMRLVLERREADGRRTEVSGGSTNAHGELVFLPFAEVSPLKSGQQYCVVVEPARGAKKQR